MTSASGCKNDSSAKANPRQHNHTGMSRLHAFVLLSALCAVLSHGQALDTAKLDAFFKELESRDLVMGSLAISQDGVIRYRRAFGYAHMDGGTKIPANTDTRYRIGSVSKLFTAAIIFQLIEEGKVALDQKLDLYFPSLPNAGRITIGNLLNHRSGLHDYTEGTDFREWMDKARTPEQMLEVISDKGADFEPNARAAYSNTNYLLLSYIIEKACATTYEDALKERVIRKIGLRNTYYGAPIDPAKNESASYKYHEGGWGKEKETDMSIHAGAGSIVSTPADLARFIEALFSHELVNESSLNRMKSVVDAHGMGLFPFTHAGRAALGHNGRIEEFYSTLQHFPDHKLTVSFVSNGILFPRSDILDGVLKICFDEPVVIPFSGMSTPAAEDLDKLLGEYSSSSLPAKVSVTRNNAQLLLKTQGATFETEPINANYFMHSPSGYFFEFHPDHAELRIKETDNVYYLKREK